MKINPENVKTLARVYSQINRECIKPNEYTGQRVVFGHASEPEERQYTEITLPGIYSRMFQILQPHQEPLLPLIRDFSGHGLSFGRELMDLVGDKKLDPAEASDLKTLLTLCLVEQDPNRLLSDTAVDVYRSIRGAVVNDVGPLDQQRTDLKLAIEGIKELREMAPDPADFRIDVGLFFSRMNEAGKKLQGDLQQEIDEINSREFFEDYNEKTCLFMLASFRSGIKTAEICWASIPKDDVIATLEKVEREHRFSIVRDNASKLLEDFKKKLT